MSAVNGKETRVAVAICSVGRAEQLRETLRWLTRQTKAPSQVVLAVTDPSDLPPNLTDFHSLPLEVVFCKKGLTRQRNCALDALHGRCDILFFIDDDYFASRSALAALETAFHEMPEVTGITGKLLADGINIGGIGVKQATDMILDFEERSAVDASATSRGRRGLYGCNMAFRASTIGDVRFDEDLPLYGWQEDVDFSNRVDGKNILLDSLVGVHCGTTLGRETKGKLLGYSQIANPLYLYKKGSILWHHAARLVLGNVFANLLKRGGSVDSIDRTGRLSGNFVALGDIVRLKLHPKRMESLRRS